MRKFLLGTVFGIGVLVLVAATTNPGVFNSLIIGGGKVVIDDAGVLTAQTPIADGSVADTLTIGASSTVDDAAIPSGVTRDTEWDTLAEINAASTDTDAVLDTDIGGTVQAWDATLDDIADGTIAENLVNTANPWGDDEVTNDLTIYTNKAATLNGGITASSISMGGSIIPYTIAAIGTLGSPFSTGYFTSLDIGTLTLTNPLEDVDVADTLTIGASSTVADGALSANVSLLGSAINLASEVMGTLPATAVGNGLTDTQVNDALTISGGTVNNSVIGGTTPAAGSFTTATTTGSAAIGTTINTNARLVANGSPSAWSSINLGANIYVKGTTRNNAIGFEDVEGNDYAAISISSTGTFRFDTMPALGAVTAPTLRMSLDTTGNMAVTGQVDAATLELGATDSVTPDANANNLKIENTSGNTGLSIISSLTGTSNVYFGDSGSSSIGQIVYNNTGNTLAFTTNAAMAGRFESDQSLTIFNDLLDGGSGDIGASGNPFTTGYFTTVNSASGIFSGDVSIGGMANLGDDGTALTITTNAITVTKSYHLVNGGTVNNINGGAAGDILYLTCIGYSPPLTIAHNSGSGTTNIFTKTGASLTINGNGVSNTNDLAILIHRGSEWLAWELQP